MIDNGEIGRIIERALMVKSRRSASSSGVPKRLSRMTSPSLIVIVLPCCVSSGVVGTGARKWRFQWFRF